MVVGVITGHCIMDTHARGIGLGNSSQQISGIKCEKSEKIAMKSLSKIFRSELTINFGPATHV